MQEREILDTKEAAEFLYGDRGRVNGIYNMVARKQIPYRKPTGRLVFLRSELMEFVRQAPGLKPEEITEQRESD